MLFLDGACDALRPVVRLVKFGVIPLIQAGIIIALIVLLVLDLGKAVMAGKEDEIKSAQKMAIKRAIYAALVFFVPVLVNVVFKNIVPTAQEGSATSESSSALSCYFSESRK